MVIAGMSFVAANKVFLFGLDKWVYAREMRADFELRKAADKLLTVLHNEPGWRELYLDSAVSQDEEIARHGQLVKRPREGMDGSDERMAKIRKRSCLG